MKHVVATGNVFCRLFRGLGQWLRFCEPTKPSVPRVPKMNTQASFVSSLVLAISHEMGELRQPEIVLKLYSCYGDMWRTHNKSVPVSIQPQSLSTAAEDRFHCSIGRGMYGLAAIIPKSRCGVQQSRHPLPVPLPPPDGKCLWSRRVLHGNRFRLGLL